MKVLPDAGDLCTLRDMNLYETQPALVEGHHISPDGLIYCDESYDCNRPWSDCGSPVCVDCYADVTTLVEWMKS